MKGSFIQRAGLLEGVEIQRRFTSLLHARVERRGERGGTRLDGEALATRAGQPGRGVHREGHLAVGEHPEPVGEHVLDARPSGWAVGEPSPRHGNKVDVLLTVSNVSGTDQTGGGSTTTLLQNVEILAVDQRVDVPAENKVDVKEMRSVTLLVTPVSYSIFDDWGAGRFFLFRRRAKKEPLSGGHGQVPSVARNGTVAEGG